MTAKSLPVVRTCGELYWVPDFVEDKRGNVILLNWQLRRPSEHNKFGFERLGKLRRVSNGWTATRNGQPILVWKHSQEALRHCARQLVVIARVLADESRGGK